MKRTICLVTALILVVFAFAGCSAKPAAELTVPDILSKSYDSMQAAKSFHFLMEHSTSGTPIGSGILMTKLDGDIVSPDKLHVTIDGTYSGMAVQVELTSVGESAMMTNPLSGKWEEVSDMFKVLTVFDPGSGVAAIIKGLNNGSKLDDEKIGDIQCYHLKGDILSESLAPLTGTTAKGAAIATEVWIDKESLLVQQIKLTGKITDAETDGIVRTLTFTNYNKDVDIALPTA